MRHRGKNQSEGSERSHSGERTLQAKLKAVASAMSQHKVRKFSCASRRSNRTKRHDGRTLPSPLLLVNRTTSPSERKTRND